MNKTETASESPKPAAITPKNGNMMRHEAMHTVADKRISKDLIVGPPNFRVNRFKIDNRPVQFRILPPLPEDISDVSLFPTLSLSGFKQIPRSRSDENEIWLLDLLSFQLHQY